MAILEDCKYVNGVAYVYLVEQKSVYSLVISVIRLITVLINTTLSPTHSWDMSPYMRMLFSSCSASVNFCMYSDTVFLTKTLPVIFNLHINFVLGIRSRFISGATIIQKRARNTLSSDYAGAAGPPASTSILPHSTHTRHHRHPYTSLTSGPEKTSKTTHTTPTSQTLLQFKRDIKGSGRRT